MASAAEHDTKGGTLRRVLGSRLFRTAVGILLLVALVVSVKPHSLVSAFSNLTVEIAILSLAISFLLVYLSAFKWNLFIRAFSESSTSILRLFGLYLVGYFVNLLLPSHVGGDAVRSWHAGKKVGQHQAFSATILERFTGLIAMASLAMVFVWIVPQVQWTVKAFVVLFSLALVVVTLWALSGSFVRHISALPGGKKIEPHLARVQSTFFVVRREPRVFVYALLVSFAYHLVTVLNTVVAGIAVGWPNPPVKELFVMLPIILFIGALPVAPAGLGVQEGAFFVFLQMLGATQEQALGVGLVLRVKTYILGALGGVVWMTLPARGAAGQAVEEAEVEESVDSSMA